MARKSKARGRKRVTKDLAPRRQAKGGKGEVTGLEPQLLSGPILATRASNPGLHG